MLLHSTMAVTRCILILFTQMENLKGYNFSLHIFILLVDKMPRAFFYNEVLKYKFYKIALWVSCEETCFLIRN